MNKKYLLLALLALAAIVVFLFIKKGNQKDIVEIDDRVIYFYQTGCSSCDPVNEYIKDNKIEEKISIQKKNILNKSNFDLMAQKADVCGLLMSNVGVPFFWTGEKCLIGERDILNFFDQKFK